MERPTDKTTRLLALIRNGRPMTLAQQLSLTVRLSLPAVIAQLSAIVMQYIDAAMVGHRGAEASAAIGLVLTTTWLFWGLCAAAASGFSVQVAFWFVVCVKKKKKKGGWFGFCWDWSLRYGCPFIVR